MSDALNALTVALGGIELMYIEHSCGEECWEGPAPRDPAVIAGELMDALAANGWSLVRADPFAAASPPSGCCGGAGRPALDVLRRGRTATNAPAVGGADADLPDLAERLEHVEAIVLGRDGPSVLDTLAERLTALEDKWAF